MTTQVSETLIFNGEEVSLRSCPSLPKSHPRLIQLDEVESENSLIGTTACWCNYIGTWEIKNSKFYLVNITGQYKLVGKSPIHANWFSGILRIPKGNLIHYVHMGFESASEQEIHVKIEKGAVVNDGISKSVLSETPLQRLKKVESKLEDIEAQLLEQQVITNKLLSQNSTVLTEVRSLLSDISSQSMDKLDGLDLENHLYVQETGSDIDLNKNHEAIFERLKNIIVAQLAVEPDTVIPDAHFINDLNVKSDLDAVELVIAIEEEFDIELPDDVTDRIATVQQAVDYLILQLAEREAEGNKLGFELELNTVGNTKKKESNEDKKPTFSQTKHPLPQPDTAQNPLEFIGSILDFWTK